MANDYNELQADVSDWMARGDVSGSAAKFIMLAEAHLNREIPAVELDAPLTGVVDSRRIDISSLSMESPIALFMADPSSGEEAELTPKTDGTFPYSNVSSLPTIWTIDGDGIDFDCPLSQEITFRFRYRQKFALSDTSPTNWLLENHYDVYLAATIMWGGVFIQGDALAQMHSAILERAIPSIKSSIARKKRAVASVDPALSGIGRRPYFNGRYG